MINSRIFSTGLLTVTVLAGSGCATRPHPSVSSTPDSACINHAVSLPVDDTLQGQSNQFSGDLFDCRLAARLKTIGTDAAIGAGIGALAGAVGCKIAGANPLLCGLAGGAVGAAAGAAYGKLEADRNESAEEIEITNQALAVLQQEKQNIAKYITQVESTNAANNERLEELKKQLKKMKAKAKTKAKAKQEIDKLNKEIAAQSKVVQTTLTNLKRRKEEAIKTLPKNNNPEIAAKIKEYQDQIDLVEKLAQRDITTAG